MEPFDTREPEFLAWPWQQVVEAAKVTVTVLPDTAALYRHMAEQMAAELRAHLAADRPTRWIIPVGPTGQYGPLVEIINRERLDLSRLYTFQMDEYLDWTCRPLSTDHPLSFGGTLQRRFFSQIDPDVRPPANRHFAPNPRHLDDLAEAIDLVGGIDTCWGGIGVHGHIAFNEPPSTYFQAIGAEEMKNAPTMIVALQPDTRVINAVSAAGGNFEAIPPYAVTIGMREILGAKRIRLCAHRHLWQRAVWRRAVLQSPTVRYPATFIQEHPDAGVFVDEATAAPAALHL
jgi:glucosamine-6-phosphate deaminase